MTTVNGQKVLQKAPLETIFKRSRVFIGPTTWSNYTFEADVQSRTLRRQMANIGITALTPFNGKVYFFANTFTGGQLRDGLFSLPADAPEPEWRMAGGYGPNDDGYASVHLRAPDGTIFELVLDPAHETRSRP